jgi:MFS superfamily sulfate permease-like transporter
LWGDLLAALAGWAVLVPQALACAQLAHLPAGLGLAAALPAAIAYAILGPSRLLAVGPESAAAVLTAAATGAAVAGSVERRAQLAALMAILAGAMLVVGAVLRLGVLSRLLSRPVLTGYMAGTSTSCGTRSRSWSPRQRSPCARSCSTPRP